MSDIRLVDATLTIECDVENFNPIECEREYIQLSESENDAIGQWLRSNKAKSDVGENDTIIIQLLSELYRKIDRLEQVLLNTEPNRVILSIHARIGRIGYEYFELTEPVMEIGKHYYGRLEIPIHPIREAGLYFEALSPTLAKIIRIHQKDSNKWGMYMMARERAIIRHLKGYE